MPIECSVLSDSNKRLLFDVGVYDSDDDEADVNYSAQLDLIIL